ncbi:hypothetical protein F5877DRAFT_84070 [Lentinula edodes]|nr:hypothetical protein F5877DRAFT_84070 [Lentinula edodes]
MPPPFAQHFFAMCPGLLQLWHITAGLLLSLSRAPPPSVLLPSGTTASEGGIEKITIWRNWHPLPMIQTSQRTEKDLQVRRARINEGTGRSGGGAPPPGGPSGGSFNTDSDKEGSNPSGGNSGRFQKDKEELPTGAPATPPTHYDHDQPWYYDLRQGWHHKAAPRPSNKGQNSWESNEEKS